jgi:hypothetical protein
MTCTRYELGWDVMELRLGLLFFDFSWVSDLILCVRADRQPIIETTFSESLPLSLLSLENHRMGCGYHQHLSGWSVHDTRSSDFASEPEGCEAIPGMTGKT